MLEIILWILAGAAAGYAIGRIQARRDRRRDFLKGIPPLRRK